MVVVFGLTGLAGGLMGYGVKDAILYLALPIMGGGMGAGAVPLTEIFGTSMNIDSGTILSKMLPAVALGNALVIVVAGLLSKLTKGNPKFSGEGKLMKTQAEPSTEKEKNTRCRLFIFRNRFTFFYYIFCLWKNISRIYTISFICIDDSNSSLDKSYRNIARKI